MSDDDPLFDDNDLEDGLEVDDDPWEDLEQGEDEKEEEAEPKLTAERKRWLKVWTVKVIAGLSVLAGVFAVLSLSWIFAGPISTIVYVMLFVFGASFLPTAVLLGAPSFPRSLKSVFGKLHFTLGQMAFEVGYLVQREDRWEMCPGTRDEVFIDDRWHEIEGGKTNLSVLGWKPFGILRYKTEETLQEERVDLEQTPRQDMSINDIASADVSQIVGDGGRETPTIERAGIPEHPPKPSVVGEGEWLIDLKRVFNRGLKKFGDISVIEKAEEVTMRKEAKSSSVSGMEAIIGSIVGLVLGLATGYVMLGGV